MLPGRRKSGLQVQVDSGPDEADLTTSRPRNRLSKPPSLSHTLKSASTHSLHDRDEPRHANADSLAVADKSVKIAASGPNVGKPDLALHVSDLVSRFELSQQQAPNNSSQLSLLSIDRRLSSHTSSLKSAAESHRLSFSNANTTSRDRITTLKNDSRTSLSPSPSPDEPADKTRFSRRSSHAPGVATRKSSVVECIKEERESTEAMSPLLDARSSPKIIDDDARSFDEGDDEDWFPPPQVPRAETPQSLDYTHLGGLSLGSLQVVNGRTSPAPSNMSKQLFMRRPTARDTSSEYADSETGGRLNGDSVYSTRTNGGRLNGDSVYSTRNRYRDFSWQSNAPAVPPLPGKEAAADPADFLASEYMAELPQSPYAERKPSFPQAGMLLGGVSHGNTRSTRHSSSTGSYHSYESVDEQSQRSSSPISSLKSDTGSVLRTTTKRTEMDDDLFEDEVLQESHYQDRHTPDTWHSWSDPHNARLNGNEGFLPALEYRESDEEVTTTISHGYQKTEVVVQESQIGSSRASIHVETNLLQPTDGRSRSPSSAGIGSALDFAYSPIDLEPLSQPGTNANASSRQPSVEADRRSLVDKVFKPILKTRRTTSDVPAFKNIKPAPISAKPSTTSVVQVQPVKASEPETPKKARRLTKRLPLFMQKQPIVLQTIQSIDDLSIPPVSEEAAANLRIRSEAVPELQTTYTSMDHVRNRHSVSTVAMDDFQDFKEIRFPSPEPERPAQHRRRSWFGRIKEEKPISKPRNSKRLSRDADGISETHARAIINDWDYVAPSLGGTPYDMLPGRNESQKQTRRLRHRSMMDARTASELARQKSASIRERDAFNSHRTSADNSRKSSLREQRSGMPAMHEEANIVLNMPPMPIALPHEPRRSYESRRSYEIPAPRAAPPAPPSFIPAPDIPPPPPPPHSPQPSLLEYHYHEHPLRGYGSDEDDGAPPPPPHSPRPADVEQDDYFSEPQHYETREESIAPPPPSHSPRPRDISDSNPWAAQAAAWKAHREHAARSQDDFSAYPRSNSEEPLYPSIPTRERQHPRSAGPDFTGYHYPVATPARHHTYDAWRSHEPQFQLSQDQRSQPRYYAHASSRDPSPRPSSRHSSIHHSSLYDAPPVQPPVSSGRYSGGLGYQYDARDGGLGGSAGLRDGSASSRGEYKGIEERGVWGVDLGDVPVSLNLARV
jgi:hypothetical protein